MPVVRFAAWLLASWLWCAAAFAQTVQGYVLDDQDVRIPLTHVVAVWLDGAETGEPPSVRVALTDRPVAAELLEGLQEPEILHLADRGGVRGLLLRFAAADPEFVYVDVLEAREENGWRMVDQALVASESFRLGHADRDRVAAELEADSWVRARLRFEAPLAYDPVVRRLDGAEARGSELVQLALRRLEAQLAGDQNALAAVATRRSAERFARRPADLAPLVEAMRANAPALRERLANPHSAVFRSRTATLVYENYVEEFALEDGVWKTD